VDQPHAAAVREPFTAGGTVRVARGRSPHPRPRRPRVVGLAAAVALGTLAGCATLFPSGGDERVGLASWYGSQHQGRRTASGQPFDMHRLVAAHRTLPLGSQVRVVNLENGRSVVVRIVDRGPYVPGRVIDVSYAAARALGILERGVVRVRLEAVDVPD
jgi:peptidoglycan lytic transglycosylase